VEINYEPIALDVKADGRIIFIELTDGKTVSFPAERFIKGNR
jgi:hypothetical protein